MTVKLLTGHHLEILSLTGGCTGSSESIHVKMPHCWKSHVTAHILMSQNEYMTNYWLSAKQFDHKNTPPLPNKTIETYFRLFDLILYVPSTIIS